MNFKEYSQEWFEDGQIDEVAFCENFLQRMPLKCINGIFFSYDGMLPDSEVEKEIYRMVKPVLTKGISKKVKQLLEVLKLEAYSEELPVQMDRIHVNNGTYFLNGDFTEKKEFCLNRLPVKYEMKETKPERWLKFLSELLEEDDIPTLQEYMGYCLIPSNKAQKLLIILGKGGEGKSRIGLVMRKILGTNMNVSNIQKVEHNRFARADLEYRLLMVDDDMKLEALKDTNYIKTIVTLEDKMDLERKSKQSVQGNLYVRFLCFGNGSLSALHDRSYKIERILDGLGLKKYENYSPLELSKGTMQRLNNACAMIQEEKITIFDEPFSGLDPVQMKLLENVIVEFHKKEKGIYIISSHDIECLQNVCDKCLLLHNGQIREINMEEVDREEIAKILSEGE